MWDAPRSPFASIVFLKLPNIIYNASECAATTNVQSNQTKCKHGPLSRPGFPVGISSTHKCPESAETSGIVSEAKSTLSSPREMTRSGKCDVAVVYALAPAIGSSRREGRQARCAVAGSLVFKTDLIRTTSVTLQNGVRPQPPFGTTCDRGCCARRASVQPEARPRAAAEVKSHRDRKN